MGKELLLLNDLATSFFTYRGEVKAVDDVNLMVRKGETLGVVGETGSGKTVTALSIMRLVPPPGKIVRGKIFFLGKNLLELSDEHMRKIRGNRISMVFQEPLTSLNPVLKIIDQLSEGIMYHKGLSKSEAREKSIHMLKRVRIGSPLTVAKNYPHELSAGMRQRVMIAIALLCEPDLLIADEPTSALDVTIQAEILQLIKNLKEEFSTSLLIITHNLGIIGQMCKTVATMYAGQVLEYGDVEKVFKEPKHPYTKGLLASIPKFGVYEYRLETLPGTLPDPANLPSGCRFSPRCSYAQKICNDVRPKLKKLESGHWIACHL